MNPPKNRAPAFQFYADDFISGVADMTDAEVGLYVRLLCAQWTRGSLPNDTEELLRFSRGSTTLQVERVRRKFEVCPDGQLRNARLEAEREKQAAWREKSRAGGQKSGLVRSLMKGGSSILQPPYEPKGNSPSPSPSPIGDHTHTAGEALESMAPTNANRGEPFPTLETALAFADRAAITRDCATKWFLECDARGGLDRSGQPVTRWKSALQAFWVSWRGVDGKNAMMGGGRGQTPPRGRPGDNPPPSDPPIDRNQF